MFRVIGLFLWGPEKPGLNDIKAGTSTKKNFQYHHSSILGRNPTTATTHHSTPMILWTGPEKLCQGCPKRTNASATRLQQDPISLNTATLILLTSSFQASQVCIFLQNLSHIPRCKKSLGNVFFYLSNLCKHRHSHDVYLILPSLTGMHLFCRTWAIFPDARRALEMYFLSF